MIRLLHSWFALFSSLICCLCLACAPTTTAACTRATEKPTPQALISAADAIVLTHVDEGAKATLPGDHAIVSHKCAFVLKGSPCTKGSILEISGYIWDKDELVPGREIPIRSARPSADGQCVTMGYTANGWYLLMLKRRKGRLTPYWEALSPTNEQVSGINDPWVVWVTQEVKRNIDMRHGR